MFPYPFCYTPSNQIVNASKQLIKKLDFFRANADGSAISTAAKSLTEGKMMGVMMVGGAPEALEQAGAELIDGDWFIFAFSGLAGSLSTVPGFVPPIFDTLSMPELRGRNTPEQSRSLQERLFRMYRVRDACGSELSVHEVFELRGIVPPGGTGDCAAPKLLNWAYLNNLSPLDMGEFWYGASPEREVREQGRFYPSCTGKCGPLLTWMMQGLPDLAPNPLDEAYSFNGEPKIIYEDDTIIVADKPSGMLSVPGRTGAMSLLDWLRERFGQSVESCHRLDMDTSGIMVFARTQEAKTKLEEQFANRGVTKAYRARLEASDKPFGHAPAGTIALPLGPDWYDRPRQMVDYENGKLAVTKYEVLQTLPDGSLEVRFYPQTGRTHQLRVHSASVKGLGRPIKGDRLYGSPDGGPLMLRAEYLAFTHPGTGKIAEFRVI